MAAAVSLTVHLRDGSAQTISQPVGNGHGIVRYDQLVKSLTNVQEKANNILTTLVNQEKAQKTTGCRVEDSNVNSNNGVLETDNSDGNEADGIEDEDDEDDDDDSTDKPPEKKQKT